MLRLQNCAVRSGCGSFSISTFVKPPSKKTEENGGDAALPAQRMMALGPGGVAAAGGVVYLGFVAEILAIMVTTVGDSMISRVVFCSAGRPTRALSARLTT